MRYKKYILESFKKLDTEDRNDFYKLIPDNTLWTQNNTHVISGKGNVQSELKKFYASVHSSNHVFLNVWEVDDTYVITADLSVKNFSQVLLEFSWTAIVNMHDGVMTKIHLFTTPVL